MCRAAGRRCEHKWGARQRERDLARRREKYHAKKAAAAAGGDGRAATPAAAGLSDKQASFFADSKVARDGVPIRVFHGSQAEFDSFDPNTVGRGNDSWGNGYYFTDQESVAYREGGDSANVKEFYLNMKNPIYVDGIENMSLAGQELDKKTVLALLRAHPDTYLQPDSDDDRQSFLSDYSERYWDKEEWTREELDQMVEEAVDQHLSSPSWGEMENLYGKDHGQKFLDVMQETTGHDGVIVDFGDDGKHYVAWNNTQMKLTSNADPDSSAKF